MDRREAVLRELNLYPVWVRRTAHVAEVSPVVEPHAKAVVSTVSVSATGEEQVVEPAQSPSHIVKENKVEQQPSEVSVELSWSELKQKVRDCADCKLRSGCTQTVIGVGDEKADWLFVGEGPGADEDVQGEPFVGKAGQLLNNMLLAIKLKRGCNVYISNIVKCRPPANRAPVAEEIASCLPYLQRQIALIQPKVIVALGKTAANTLLGKSSTLGSLRGALHDFQGTPLVVTYHPAYLLRSPSEKAKAWQDLCLATAAMQEL